MMAKNIPGASFMAARVLLFLSLTLALGPTAQAQNASPAQTENTSAPLLVLPLPKDGDGKEVVLRAVGDAKEASANVYLRRAKDAPVINRIFAHLLDANGQVVSGAIVTLVDDKATNLLTTPPTVAMQPAVLRVEKIDSMGTFSLRLVVQAGDSLTELKAISVQRFPADPPWAGAIGGSLALTTGRANFTYRFELSAGAIAPKTQIEFGDLTDEAGNVIPAQWTMDGKKALPTNQPYEFSSDHGVRPRLDAQLAGIGTYQTTLTLVRSGERRVTPIKITRTKPSAATVALHGLNTTRATVGLTGSGYVPVWMTLQETSNQGASVTALTTSTLTLKNPQKGPAAATFERAELVRKADGSAATLPLSLQPTATEQLELRFWKLVEPGEYSGTVLLTTGDGETLSKEFTLYLKKSAWLAGFWILIGVLASTGIRMYVNRVRPQLVQLENHRAIENNAATVQASLPVLEREEEEVWNNWQGQLEILGKALNGDPVPDGDARLTLLSHQLEIFPKWVTARRQVLGFPGPAVTPLRQTVQTARDYLMKVTEQATEFETLRTALNGIDAQIAQARQTELDQRLTALIAGAREQRNSLGTDAGRAKLDQWLTHAKAGLVGELEDREQTLQTLRGGYVALLATDFQATIASATPVGFSDDQWQKLRQDISRQTESAQQSATTEPEIALASYYAAVDSYLRATSQKLREAAEQRRQQLPPADAPRATEVITHTQAVLQSLDQAEPDRVRATTEYRAAAAGYTALPPAGGGGVMMNGPGDVVVPPAVANPIAAAVLPANPALRATPTIRSRPLRRLKSLAQLAAKRWWLDALLWFLMLAVAVVVGLKLLWVDDQVWGGWTACMTALLWGLGLHTVSNQAFEGTSGLLTKITK